MFSQVVIVLSLSLSLSLYIYIYIYMCVCVCVCINLRFWNDWYSFISISGSYFLSEHEIPNLFTQSLFNVKPIYNLGRFTNYHMECNFGWFFSGSPGEFSDNTLNWITTVTLPKLPIPKFNINQILDIIISETCDFKYIILKGKVTLRNDNNCSHCFRFK